MQLPDPDVFTVVITAIVTLLHALGGLISEADTHPFALVVFAALMWRMIDAYVSRHSHKRPAGDRQPQPEGRRGDDIDYCNYTIEFMKKDVHTSQELTVKKRR